MDNTKDRPTVLPLCTGYGGLEIGLDRALGGVSVLAHVEIEAFAVANLVNKMETGQMVPAPIWTDLKTFRAGSFRGSVDILTGGYPCQPFSAAGKRAGTDDPRHLWPYIRDIVDEIEPGWVFFENVEGHISLGVCEVLADLEEMGYTVTCGIFSAAEVGAPHQRKRVFILGYSKSDHKWGLPDRTLWAGLTVRGSSSELARLCSGTNWPARPGEEQFAWEEPRTVVADSDTRRGERGDTNKPKQIRKMGQCPTSGEVGHNGHPGKTEPRLGRATNGTSSRVDRLRLLGNGVVPQVAEKAFITLHNKLTQGGQIKWNDRNRLKKTLPTGG